MPDAIVLLKEDHKTVEALFKRFEKLEKSDGKPSEKRKVVDQILAELSVHTAIEEKHFYPVVREKDKEIEDLVLEGVEEHHVVDVTMEELSTLDPEAENFDAKVTVLIELVRHHVEEEEQEMFPKIREAMGRNDLQALGDVMEQAKIGEPYPADQAADQAREKGNVT